MKKERKLDIRLTEEQYAWLEDQANKKTISKSACFRMLLEEMRRAEIECTAESQASYAKSVQDPDYLGSGDEPYTMHPLAADSFRLKKSARSSTPPETPAP